MEHSIIDIPRKVQTNLFCGQITLKNGQDLYFGFEKVDDRNYDFWRYYSQQAYYKAGYCNAFCKSIKKENGTQYPNSFSDAFHYTEEQFYKVTEFIQKKGFFAKSPLPGVKGGQAGMEQVFSRSCKDKQVFMVYASSTPVNRVHTINLKEIDIKDVKDYEDIFGHIVMSLVFITKDDAPTVSHYGIFRNPISFLDATEKYKGISMKVHGFAAQVALTHFEGKKYMITNPMPSMGSIMAKTLGCGSIFIGTNEDLISEKDEDNVALLKKHPPIYHIDRTTGIHKIAKEGTDLTHHLESLPDENAEFIAKRTSDFDFSGWTIGAMKTVIKLEKLAEFYFNE